MMKDNDRLSIDALERIDQSCCRFESDLKQEANGDLHQYLTGSTGLERSTLLYELISLDIDYGCRRGRDVTPAPYHARFPDDRSAIDKAFSHRQKTNTSPNKTADGARNAPDGFSTTPESIGRYRILRRIAAGGFGVVYRGFDDELKRDVAIKVPYRNVVMSERQAERFFDEARLVANLNHPGIVPVYDAGRTDSGQCYVVSKFMEGGDLRARIRASKLSPAEAAGIVAQVADALNHAHERRLVHRDIKPSNLLMDANGSVYLADFGAATLENSSNSFGFVGTPAYMSPEQARGESHRVDARTDVFALGVVLFELMTGVSPFRNDNVSQMLADVIAKDPVSPRQLNVEIPIELERISLKAMSKRAADRYQTAREISDDLLRWNESREQFNATTASVPDQVAVIPKGLRSFDATDAEFFMQLLPGPRDRDGLPESIRFWRDRIEDTMPDQAPRVGVIYGPSGCGKSSLVKAGLLPRLGRHVQPIYIEARGESTEDDLLHALRQAADKNLPSLTLPSPPLFRCAGGGEGTFESVARLRRVQPSERGLPELLRSIRNKQNDGSPKILIVIDQFEQWLHTQHNLATAPLTRALRQCDGIRSQCLLLVRDDFWMPLVRFMAELEIPLLEHDNTMAVDLFDMAHAKRVLMRFGQAYDRSPANASDLSRDQTRFFEDALASLQRDGTVSPIRLSLFAEMMKNDAWEPATLRRLGGAEGLGVTFLDRFFSRSQSLPAHRLHAVAARNVLQLLLPDLGVDIRGHIRSRAELLHGSGYVDRPDRFEELLPLLDQQLRLVTPTEPEREAAPRSDPQPAVTRRTDKHEAPETQTYYQLTHDFMVAPIREWVTQGQRQTIRGRAELCLAERVSLWMTKPENRQLPGFFEWARIRLFTNPGRWTAPQQDMIKRAAWRSAAQLATVAAVMSVLGLIGWQAAGRIRANSALATIRRADNDDLLEAIRDVRPVHRWLTPLLKNELTKSETDPHDRRFISLALLEDDPGQAMFLCEQLLTVDPSELRVIRDGIVLFADQPSKQNIARELWEILDNSNEEGDRRFRAACALAGLAPSEPRWNAHSESVVMWLLSQKKLNQLSDWLRVLRPAKRHLTASLERVFLATDSESGRQIATYALADFLEGNDESERIVELIKRARPSQLPALVDTVREDGDAAIALLKNECQIEFTENESKLPPNRKTPPKTVVQPFHDAHGIVTSRFAFCQTLPVNDLPAVVDSLGQYGYRPIRLRPFRHDNQTLVAGIWSRDRYDWRVESGLSGALVRQLDAEYREHDLGVEDVAAYLHDEEWRFIAVWSTHPDALKESRLSLAKPRAQWQAGYDKNTSDGFYPRTLQYGIDGGHAKMLSQLWRKQSGRWAFEQRFGVTRERVANGGPDYVLHDVSAFFGWHDVPYGVIWNVDSYMDCETLMLGSPDEMLEQWPAMYRNGFHPVAICLATDASTQSLRSTSVWHRRTPTAEAKRRFADIKSNMIVALLSLGDTETSLPFFRHVPDPTLRTYLVQKLGPARVPTRVFQPCLQDESLEPDVRQALILALGYYSASSLTPNERSLLIGTLQHVVRDAPDAGVHSAAQWTLQRWNAGVPRLAKATDDKPLAHRNWYVTPSGHTMVLLDCPDTYQPITDKRLPPSHRFAIATTEVTVKDYLKFRPEHGIDWTARSSATCPAPSMDWYGAVAYCNWLSDQEGIPESEWCYRPNENGDYAEGMTIATDLLKRRGYRLALATEWLYAATAEAETRLFFGTDVSMLEDFGWVSKNSQGLIHPVGLLQPNLFGLFDVNGNVKEWGHSLEIPGPDDRPVTDDDHRCTLGVSYRHFEHHITAEQGKHGNPANFRGNQNGLRVARTVFEP